MTARVPTTPQPIEIVLPIEGMTCASCVNRIERFLKKTPGVELANVNLATERATVLVDPGTAGRDELVRAVEAAGYEVLVFHATGTGGRTMEGLIADGFIAGSLDMTTTELADEVCGGVLSAGPERCLAASRAGVPAVLVPGCVDMANFGGIETVPERYRSRRLYQWNPNITLLRTTPDENRRIGEMIAAAANAATAPVAVLLPGKGVSMLDAEGHEFWDPEADGACFGAIRAGLRPGIPLIEIDANVNDPLFSGRVAETLLAMLPAG